MLFRYFPLPNTRSLYRFDLEVATLVLNGSAASNSMQGLEKYDPRYAAEGLEMLEASDDQTTRGLLPIFGGP